MCGTKDRGKGRDDQERVEVTYRAERDTETEKESSIDRSSRV